GPRVAPAPGAHRPRRHQNPGDFQLARAAQRSRTAVCVAGAVPVVRGIARSADEPGVIPNGRGRGVGGRSAFGHTVGVRSGLPAPTGVGAVGGCAGVRDPPSSRLEATLSVTHAGPNLNSRAAANPRSRPREAAAWRAAGLPWFAAQGESVVWT